jgi:hypothetical protein
MSQPHQSLKVATRSALFGRKPLWRQYAATTAQELSLVGQRLQLAIPDDLVKLLLYLGFGDVNEELSFRKEWLTKVQGGPLAGHLIFAQDDRGNFYSADPHSEAIYFLSRSEFGYCCLATCFSEFLEQAAARNFEVVQWAESQPLVAYAGEA